MSYKKTTNVNGAFRVRNGVVFIDHIEDNGETPSLEINKKLLLRDVIEQDLRDSERTADRIFQKENLNYIEGSEIEKLRKK